MKDYLIRKLGDPATWAALATLMCGMAHVAPDVGLRLPHSGYYTEVALAIVAVTLRQK